MGVFFGEILANFKKFGSSSKTVWAIFWTLKGTYFYVVSAEKQLMTIKIEVLIEIFTFVAWSFLSIFTIFRAKNYFLDFFEFVFDLSGDSLAIIFGSSRDLYTTHKI